MYSLHFYKLNYAIDNTRPAGQVSVFADMPDAFKVNESLLIGKSRLTLMLLTTTLLVFSGGCAEIKSKLSTSDKPPELSAEAKEKLREYDYSGISANDGTVAIRVVQSILPGNDYYLPKSPTWGEYVLEVKTVSNNAITYKSASLIGSTGAFIHQAKSSADIEKSINVTNEVLFDTALLVGGGTAAMVVGASTGAILLGPLAYVGYLAYQTTKVDDALAYQKEFLKRVDAGTQTIDKNSAHTSSVFFPLVSNARSIALSYSLANGTTKEIRLEISRTGQTVNRESPSSQSSKSPDKSLSLLEAQKILNSVGLNVGKPDGILGKNTARAISKYQQLKKIPTTGSLDRPTVDALLAEKFSAGN